MTEEIARILERAEQSVDAADLLRAAGRHDIAVSRAYYAMFYAAQALLAGRGLRFSKHRLVVGKFGESFAKTGALPVKMHRQLIDAFEARLVADYDHSKDTPEGLAEHHIACAREFLAAAREHLEHNDPDA